MPLSEYCILTTSYSCAMIELKTAMPSVKQSEVHYGV